MTRRERALGIVFLGALAAALCLFGSQLYLERLRKLDAEIASAERRKARMELSLRGADSPAARRSAWTAPESTPEAFLSRFDRVARSAGWRTESTVFKGRKDGAARFSISVEGPLSGWERLLGALDAWDKQVLVESVEASAAGKGRMRALIEAGYAGK
jgi:hypothetical protein